MIHVFAFTADENIGPITGTVTLEHCFLFTYEEDYDEDN